MNRRQIIATSSAAGAIALGGAGAWWYLREDGDPKGASNRMDLLAGAYAGSPHETDHEAFAMLNLTGGMPGRTGMELRLYDLDAAPLSAPEDLSATLTNLVTGESATDLQLEAQDDGSWQVKQETLESDGWWQLVLTWADLTAYWTFMLPDPNLTGFGTPPTVDADPDATAMLVSAVSTLTNRTSLRWWEWLSGGNGSIVLARFSVTTEASNGLPDAFESDSMLAGRIPQDGTPPSFREENTRTVSTSEGAMRSINEGTPEATNVIQYLPIAQYDSTYANNDGAHFGTTAEIGGRECQLIAFHLPGAAEAWFAFWIDIETLFIRELFMHSVNHYMHWIYYDFDEPFELSIDA